MVHDEKKNHLYYPSAGGQVLAMTGIPTIEVS